MECFATFAGGHSYGLLIECLGLLPVATVLVKVSQHDVGLGICRGDVNCPLELFQGFLISSFYGIELPQGDVAAGVGRCYVHGLAIEAFCGRAIILGFVEGGQGDVGLH